MTLKKVNPSEYFAVSGDIVNNKIENLGIVGAITTAMAAL